MIDLAFRKIFNLTRKYRLDGVGFFFFLLFQRENIVSIDLINLASPHCFKKRSLRERKKNRLIINQKRPLPVFPQIYSLRVSRITIAQNNSMKRTTI